MKRYEFFAAIAVLFVLPFRRKDKALTCGIDMAKGKSDVIKVWCDENMDPSYIYFVDMSTSAETFKNISVPSIPQWMKSK